MSRSTRRQLVSVIDRWGVDATRMDDKESLVLNDYVKFTQIAERERHMGDMYLRKLELQELSVREWWLKEGRDWPRLQALALQVFSLPPSSAAAERSFSIQGFIHSKIRNRLQAEKAEKLMFIKFNAHQLEGSTKSDREDESGLESCSSEASLDT
ncbi:hypothetical protein AeMF1_000558 [Aphanomyces euteiches]|nr:hypothetical protein AeMF1_000558 [Aphanomyces euteiches]KAH9185674.1 hypothetical protein AeNC1_012348 [Aphanomyces euteiches]